MLANDITAWPKLKFISNRMALEKVVREAFEQYHTPEERARPSLVSSGRVRSVLSEEDLNGLLREARANNGKVEVPDELLTPAEELEQPMLRTRQLERQDSPSFKKRMSSLWGNLQSPSSRTSFETIRRPPSKDATRSDSTHGSRRSSVMDELVRQSRVFFDDDDLGEDTEPPSDADLHSQTEDEAEGTMTT